ncbi:MAG: fasciclin domain-containing protein [Myxococcales bacterium]|nr:fasciclin domain-containing protein [Myxococcales bacterium]
MMKRLNVLTLGLLLVAACSQETNRPVYPSYDSTILELAKADPDLQKFADLAEKAGLADALNSTATAVTVFAPTAAALSGVDETDADALNALLRFHMTGGTLTLNNVKLSRNLETITSTTIVVSVSGDTVKLSTSRDPAGVTVTEGDIHAINGIIHKIDGVLTPPPPEVEPLGNIIEVATDAGGFDTLLGALDDAGLTSTLQGTGPFTVFAPTDAAFTALGDISGVDGAVVTNILLTHVVSGKLDSAAVAAAASVDTLANTSAAVDASGTPVTVGGAALSADTVDVEASNGIIHAMDAVIVPPTILEVAAATADLSSLVTAVGTATLGAAVDPDTLAGDGPITVFAPTNAAFTAAGIDVTVATSTLTAVLTHHVVAGQYVSGDLTDGQTLTAANGTLTVNVAGDGSVSITDGQGNTVNVVGADIRTLSGVVHVIDGVLLP